MRVKEAAVLLPALCALTGCGELAMRQKERQMEMVARDWSMTIRASQVVPVYPLNQDIQPGDVFLVNQTVAAQSSRFRDRGFMPTDLRITRMLPEDYDRNYRALDASLEGEEDPALVLPRDWRHVPDPSTPWERFPKVGFPSYSFDISNSGGLSLALPVQAVPVALSVTGAASAIGSVTIADAVTYGVDASSMFARLLEAKRDGALDHAAPPEGEGPWYLRVVTRVFAAKTFNIVLTATSTLGGGADAGAPQPVPDPGGRLDSGQTITRINEQLTAIGKTTGPQGTPLPGGSVRATFANGRTVGFEETFSEPIVVGYHGFDVAIDSTGNIGSIIPTFQVLDGENTPPPPTAMSDDDSAYNALIDLLEALQDTHPDQVEAALHEAAAHSGLGTEFEQKLAGRPGEPVAVWKTVTLPTAQGTLGRQRLLGTLSRGIRAAWNEE